MFSSVGGFHHRGGDPYEIGSDTPIPSLWLVFVLCLSLMPTVAFAETPANVQISDTGVLTWDAFGDTGVYLIDVFTFVDGSGLVTRFSDISTREYNLKAGLDARKIESGSFFVAIYTTNGGHPINSENVSYSYVSSLPKLAEPQNLRWDGTTAKWDAVSNATSYSITSKNSTGANRHTYTTTATSYDLGTEAEDGRWFTVVATADNYRDSNTAESPKYGTSGSQDETITGNGGNEWNIRMSTDGILSWDAVGDTGVYRIDVFRHADESGLVTGFSDISTREYNLKAGLDARKIESGSFLVAIYTTNGGHPINSENVSYSYVSSLPKLAEPQNLRWDGTTAKWDAVSNATSYSITSKASTGANRYTYTTTATSYDLGTEAEDGRWFTVVATADNYRDSNTAESPKYGNTTPPVDPPVENRFVTQPQDATLEPREDYNATWSLNFEPESVNIQSNKDGEWVHFVGATATGGTISGLTGGTTRTFRVVAFNGYGTAYSDEFTVTWTDDTTLPVFEFTTQPQSGTSKKTEAYSFTFALSSTPVGIILQVWDPSDEQWIYCCDLNEYSAAVAYNSNFCKDNESKYRILTSDGNSYIYSDEFTVTWTDDTTPPAPLTELSATITAPTAGATPVYTATTGSSDYTAEVLSWRDSFKTLKNTDTFEAGKRYVAEVRFIPASGIDLSITANATINGLRGDLSGYYRSDGTVQYMQYLVDFTVPEAPPTTYTVSFNMNGHGTQVAAQTVEDGNKATKPADPTASGWTFDGWYADATFSVAFDFNTAINADTTIYAKWTQNTTPPTTTFTVSFIMNGHGDQVAAQTVNEGATATKPADPTSSGWTFDGWYADATFSAAFDFNTAINADTTIYAKWTKNTTPPAPTYTIIAGANSEWTKGSTTGLAFTSDAPFDKFDSVKVDGSTIAATNYTAEAGSTKITLAPAYLETLSVDSHSIVVVSTDGTASTNFTVKAAAQPPVPAKYTVSFNMNGHGTQIADQTVEDGSKAAKPADPKASGYTFGGWYADATFSTKFDFNTAITANTTVYAKWTKNSAAPADPTSPQTGDTSNMFLWIALLLVSGGALVGTTVYGRKKKYNAK